MSASETSLPKQSPANTFTIAGFKLQALEPESYGIYTENGTVALNGGTVTAVGSSQAMNKAPVLNGEPGQATAGTDRDGNDAVAYNPAEWNSYRYIHVEIPVSQEPGGDPGSGGGTDPGSGGGTDPGSGGGSAPTNNENTVTLTSAQLSAKEEQIIQFENGLQIIFKSKDIPRSESDALIIQAAQITERETLDTFYNAYSNEQALRKAYTVTFRSENNGASTPITQLNGQITLKFQLTSEELRHIDPDSLKVYKESEDGSVTTLAGTFDWENNTFSITTDHLCNFYLMAEAGIPAQRLSRDNRYETAVALSRQGWKTADYVVLASGEDFPDALVAASLAGLKDAPVLLTNKGSLNPKTLEEIQRLQAKTVYILGGTNAISQKVEDQLAKTYTIQRIAGADRYETALKLGEILWTASQGATAAGQGEKQTDDLTKDLSKTVILATGLNYPDTLSIAPFAAQYRMPNLFTGKDRLHDKTAQALKDWGVQKVILVGGTGVIGEAVEKTLTDNLSLTVTRLGGADRYATNRSIVDYFVSFGNTSGSEGSGTQDPAQGFTQAAFATGKDYPDALAGAAFAGKGQMPLFLVDTASANTELKHELGKWELEKLYLIGGEAVLPDTVKKAFSTNLRYSSK